MFSDKSVFNSFYNEKGWKSLRDDNIHYLPGRYEENRNFSVKS